MSFADMNKEKKQLLILSAGGALTLFMIVTNVILNPAKARAAEARETIGELSSQVRTGELILRKDQSNRKVVSRHAARILELRATELPPENSRYIWALRNVTSLAREVGVKVTVRETSSLRYVPAASEQGLDKASVPMWIPYSVEVETFTSFENLKIYMDRLRAAHPYASIGLLQITSNDASPENHRVQFILEWPVLRFVEDVNWMESVAEPPEASS